MGRCERRPSNLHREALKQSRQKRKCYLEKVSSVNAFSCTWDYIRLLLMFCLCSRCCCRWFCLCCCSRCCCCCYSVHAAIAGNLKILQTISNQASLMVDTKGYLTRVTFIGLCVSVLLSSWSKNFLPRRNLNNDKLMTQPCKTF